MERIRLGISTCLLGENVRYDGGHKWDRFLTDTLGQYVEYVPVCPEVEYGLPTPREAMRLIGDPANPRLVTSRTKRDHTEGMVRWARERVKELEKENLYGFIFKKSSPSSGMEKVKVYDRDGVPKRTGVGIFARVFMSRFSLLPVEDEGRLHDPGLRENFIERIFALKRWQEVIQGESALKDLIDFHTRHKLQIMGHSPKLYQTLGRLVAGAKGKPLKKILEEYEAVFLNALRLMATPKKNSNVLQHMMGYFRAQLSGDEKKELLEVIDLYRREVLPLVVPVTLMNHYVRKYQEPYLKQQTFLRPHPLELQLRNHV
jgi:uncharacterized protein YbgA (DUF1722 family)/uncharacterized protein YbbK (DUF523 family)